MPFGGKSYRGVRKLNKLNPIRQTRFKGFPKLRKISQISRLPQRATKRRAFQRAISISRARILGRSRRRSGF
jgi:hypothetical protein